MILCNVNRLCREAFYKFELFNISKSWRQSISYFYLFIYCWGVRFVVSVTFRWFVSILNQLCCGDRMVRYKSALTTSKWRKILHSGARYPFTLIVAGRKGQWAVSEGASLKYYPNWLLKNYSLECFIWCGNRQLVFQYLGLLET